MKLNHECVRDTLLLLESLPYVITNDDGDVEFVGVWFPAICSSLATYPQEVIYYTLSKMDEAGFIDMSVHWGGGTLSSCCVNYITYEGHEFLEKIRPETVWKKTTTIAGEIGSFGLKTIGKIAEGVTTASINAMISGG
ncbi:hypothetical protein OBV_25460 [Oscillibacter valericigenes Sjm18-20]|nr:hypothetical protein OBV_25460 [Oscillibacter valericigenes Sjm18-20]